MSSADLVRRWAADRGLSEPRDDGVLRLPSATPLLRAGSARGLFGMTQGEIAPGFGGTVALLRVTYQDADYQSQSAWYAVALAEVPPQPVARLLCIRAIRGSGSVFQVARMGEELPEGARRVDFESSRFNRRYDVLVPVKQDDNPVWQLFDPAFVNWLAEDAPEDFAFQLYDGTLCGYLPDLADSVETLDGLAAATAAVAARARSESGE